MINEETVESDSETREQWILGRTLANAVNCVSTIYQSRDGESEIVNSDPEYLSNLVGIMVEQCSRMAVEDAIAVLEKAQDALEALHTAGSQVSSRQGSTEAPQPPVSPPPQPSSASSPQEPALEQPVAPAPPLLPVAGVRPVSAELHGVERFLRERCAAGPCAMIDSDSLYKQYVRCCKRHREKMLPLEEFVGLIKSRGFITRSTK